MRNIRPRRDEGWKFGKRPDLTIGRSRQTLPALAITTRYGYVAAHEGR
jgi:hypothetical protein